MKIKNLPSIICLLLFQTIWSQQLLPDSLQQKSVEDKIIFLQQEGQKHNNIDSSNVYFNEALKLAKTCDCDSLYFRSVEYISDTYYSQGNYKKAIAFIEPFLAQAKESNSTIYLFRIHTHLAKNLMLSEQHDEALKHYESALEFSKKLQNKIYLADAYNNLGDMYNTTGLHKNAKKYLLLALEVYNSINAPETEKLYTYKNLMQAVENPEDIEEYAKKALNSLHKSEPKEQASFYLYEGDAYLSKNEELLTPKHYKKSLLAFNKAITIADSLNLDIYKNFGLIGKGSVLLNLNRTSDAIAALEKAKQLPQTIPQNEFYLLRKLAVAYERNNNYKKAFITSKEMFTLQDSISHYQSKEKFAEFDAKFNLAEKDKEIALQELEIAKQRNARNKWIFSSIGTLLLGLFIILWLITKQKRKKTLVQMKLEKEQEINQLRTKFLGNIAHEIRTPLTLVSGNLNLALENLDNTTKAKKNLQVALDNTKKITDDANEILELLKFEGHKMTLNKTAVPLRTSLERIVFSFHSMAQIKAVEISYNSNIANTIFVNTDIGKIEKIINNLLSNAIKYAPSNSKIIVNDVFNTDTLSVSVTDFGEGIKYDEQKKIFERFYQSENASKVGGIGIGLALSKEFSELLNGSLTVDSKPGQGSTFTLKIPMQTTENNTENVTKPTSLIPQQFPNHNNSSIKEHILIVEDNPQMATYLKELLEDIYHCDVAFNGEEALNLLKTQTYSLITSDIMMPKIDGFELREKINTIEKHKYTPFIFISAKTLEIDKIKGFSLGIADYIVKPFNKNELIARIKNLLKNKASRIKWQLENTNQLSTTESSDQKLLRKIETYIVENLDNDDFKIKELADYVGYSQRQLARIMKQYTGMSPVKFILEIRLQKAFTFLQNKTFFTLSEVRFAVGISSSAYFNKKFKERFGIAPADLI